MATTLADDSSPAFGRRPRQRRTGETAGPIELSATGRRRRAGSRCERSQLLLDVLPRRREPAEAHLQEWLERCEWRLCAIDPICLLGEREAVGVILERADAGHVLARAQRAS